MHPKSPESSYFLLPALLKHHLTSNISSSLSHPKHSVYINLLRNYYLLHNHSFCVKVGIRLCFIVSTNPTMILTLLYIHCCYYYLGSISQQAALQVLYHCGRQSHIKDQTEGLTLSKIQEVEELKVGNSERRKDRHPQGGTDVKEGKN